MTNIETETLAAIKRYCSNKEINWEQVKVQAAVAAMQGILSSFDDHKLMIMSAHDEADGKVRTTAESVAEFSVECAEALINRLKN